MARPGILVLAARRRATRRCGWATGCRAAGAELIVLRPYAGDAVPDDARRRSTRLISLGGDMGAHRRRRRALAARDPRPARRGGGGARPRRWASASAASCWPRPTGGTVQRGRGRPGDRRVPDRETGCGGGRPAVRGPADDPGRHALPLRRGQHAAAAARCCCSPSMGYPHQAFRRRAVRVGAAVPHRGAARRRSGTGRARRACRIAGRLGPMLDDAERDDGRGVAGLRRTGSSSSLAAPSGPGCAGCRCSGRPPMTRPAVRTPARYGLPDTDRVRADLATIGLFTDAGPTPGTRRRARRDLPRRPTGAGAERAGPARRGGRGRRRTDGRAALTQPRFRGRLIGVLGGVDRAVRPPRRRTRRTGSCCCRKPPAEELISPRTMRGCWPSRWASTRTAPPCTGTDGARADRDRRHRDRRAAPGLPVAAADHRRARPRAGGRAEPADHRAARGLPGAVRAGRRHAAGGARRGRRRAAGRRGAGAARA